MIGSTGGTHGGRHAFELRSPGAARVDNRAGRNETEVGSDAEDAALVALHAHAASSRDADAARLAALYERAPEQTIIDAAFLGHEHSAGDVRQARLR